MSDGNIVLPTSEPCPTCHGTGRAPARAPFNWTPIINAAAALIILVVTSLGAKFASNADSRAETAAVQSRENADKIEDVKRDVKATHETAKRAAKELP